MAVDEETGIVFAEDLPLGGAGREIGPQMSFEVPEDSLVAKDPAALRAEYEQFVKEQAERPAKVTRNIGYGAAGLAEGLFDPFAGLGKALSTSGDVKRLMGIVRDPNADTVRKQNALNNIAELEKLHLSDNRTYAGYRTLEADANKRAAKDPRVINALNDLKAVSSAFPMLVREVYRAAASENPEAFRSLGLMLTAEGIGSAVSVMNPMQFGRNMNAMPFSTALSLVPVVRIVAKSPAALAKLRGQYQRFDEFLDAVDDVDRGVRGAFEAIGDIPVGAIPQSIPILRQLEVGVTPRKQLRLGQEPGVPKRGARVSALRPEDRLKNIRDFGDKVIKGAQVGFLAGVPVEAGLAYAALYGLGVNKFTRNNLAAMDRWIRHTSAQAGASPELAVRAILMASARDRAEIRSQANRLAKLFEEGKAFGGEGSLAMSDRVSTLAKYTEQQDSSVRQISLNELTDQINNIRKAIDEDNLPPAQRARQQQMLNRLERLAKEQAEGKVEGGSVALSGAVTTILDDIDRLAQSRGVSPQLGEALRRRVADAAGQTGLLLQAPEVIRQVSNVLVSEYGIPRKAAIEFIDNYGSAYAKNPSALPSNKIVATTAKGQGVIDLDEVVRKTIRSMSKQDQNRIMGQVVSAETMRMGGLVSNYAFNQALRAESTLGGMISNNLKRMGADPDTFKATPAQYADALLTSMFSKDIKGDMRVPQVIPASVMGRNGADLANAIRTAIVTDDGVRRLANQAGIRSNLTAAEIRNYRASMTEVADRLRTYVDQSGDSSQRAAVTRALDAQGNLPDELRNLAKKVNDDGVYVAPGLESTLSWHRGVGPIAREMNKLANYFGLSRFKGMQTVYNPISHQNNTAGNLGLMLVRWGEDPATFISNATRDARLYSDFTANRVTPYSRLQRGTPEYYRNRAVSIQDKAGVANSDFVAGELMMMEQAGITRTGMTPGRMDKIREGLAKYPRKLYSAEDNIPKLRFGMKYAQQFFQDIDNLRPGSQYEFRSSPVSTTTLVKGPDGKIYRAGKRKPLTDTEIDNLAAAYTRRQVSEHFLAYNETSGLNKMINDSTIAAAISPFFTFFHKAMGFGGTKGFLRNALEGTDGVRSTDPRVLRRQIKNQAEIAARRAYLINSFRQLTSREEDMLARAFAYSSKIPSSVIFDVLSDEDTVSFRDLTSMNSFAPAEARLRASLYMLGGIMDKAGLNKTPEQRKFLKEIEKGNVGGVASLLEIVGLGKGPIEQFKEVARQGESRIRPEPTSAQLAKVLLPNVIGPVYAVPIKEVLSEIDSSMETLSGVREVAGAPELSESRKDFLLRRFIGGSRKQGFMGQASVDVGGRKKVTARSLLDQRLRAVKTNASQLLKQYESNLVRAKARRDKLKGVERERANEEVAEINEQYLVEKKRVEKIEQEESLRLREAFEFVQKINKLRRGRR